MFKKVPYGLAALTVLKVDRALGVQLQQHQQKWNADQTNVQLGAEHRHHHKHHHHQLAQSIPACNSVECKTETAAPNKLQKDQDPWDKDYFVPNFGADHEILDSQSNHVNAAGYCKDGLCGQPWVVAAQKGTGSIPACNSVECKTETAAAAKLQKDTDPWDKDYFVPNFGVDHDIVATHSNAAAAKAYCAGDGARCGQQWQVAAQKASIPACNSIECKTETAAAAKLQKDTDPWDKDYPVPNFGVDHDILDSHSNAANAATFCKGGKCGQPWVVAAQKRNGANQHNLSQINQSKNNLVDCPLKDKDLQGRCMTGEWIPSKDEIDWYRVQTDDEAGGFEIETANTESLSQAKIDSVLGEGKHNLVQKDKKLNCPLDDPELNARCMRGEWIPDVNEVNSYRLTDDYIDDAIQVQTKQIDEAGGYEIDHGSIAMAQNQKNCPLDDPELQARCASGEWIPSKNEVDKFRLMDDYIPDEIQLQLKNKKACPLDAEEHPDLQERCARGEWIPDKGEIDSFRLMDDYIDDSIKLQLNQKKNCPLDSEEHPDLHERCERGEWIPSRDEVNSFRLMDDYISDDIKLQLHKKHKSIPACNSIECKTKSAADAGDPKHDMDYFVPNFGLDHDILNTHAHEKQAKAYCANGNCGQPWRVAAVQLENKSIPACNSIECKTKSAADAGDPKHDMDYFVPNFGLDHDILNTWAHEKQAKSYCAGGNCGQQWRVAAQQNVQLDDKSIPACNSIECKTKSAADAGDPKHDMDYFVPNFGLDHDIIDTHAHAKQAKAYCASGNCGQQWRVAAQQNVQLDNESIPACNSIECKTESADHGKDPWDKDYFVPNFGLDHDIIDTHAHAKQAKAYCANGNCGQPWQVANFANVQLENESIPACNSIECKTESADHGKDPWDKDYFVPNFGLDHDILNTWAHEKQAKAYCVSGNCGQQWVVAKK